jgi:hypothetical protein
LSSSSSGDESGDAEQQQQQQALFGRFEVKDLQGMLRLLKLSQSDRWEGPAELMQRLVQEGGVSNAARVQQLYEELQRVRIEDSQARAGPDRDFWKEAAARAEAWGWRQAFLKQQEAAAAAAAEAAAAADADFAGWDSDEWEDSSWQPARQYRGIGRGMQQQHHSRRAPAAVDADMDGDEWEDSSRQPGRHSRARGRGMQQQHHSRRAPAAVDADMDGDEWEDSSRQAARHDRGKGRGMQPQQKRKRSPAEEVAAALERWQQQQQQQAQAGVPVPQEPSGVLGVFFRGSRRASTTETARPTAGQPV